MAKRNPVNSIKSNDSVTTKLSEDLFSALTQQEIGQLIDAIFGVLTPELQEQAIEQLLSSTQQTVRQLIAPVIPPDLNPRKNGVKLV